MISSSSKSSIPSSVFFFLRGISDMSMSSFYLVRNKGKLQGNFMGKRDFGVMLLPSRQ